ncbi:hypothetical protein WJX72_002872 [[Myrmecia] bisecta]|uniref:Alpha/beta hydrolase fold-3 domain-containing protein n=1 Tax=[Myrmecia] bisecta TaxID=41462 RepID=A0AAW1P8W6_9CHLO
MKRLPYRKADSLLIPQVEHHGLSGSHRTLPLGPKGRHVNEPPSISMPVPMDPQQQAVLEALNKLPAPHEHPTTPEMLRANNVARIVPSIEELKSIEDTTIVGPNGDVGVRIYTPQTAQDSALPVLVYFHGGCWFLNSLDTHDCFMRRLANVGSIIVVAVDYRLAPENKFPAGLEDCYAATKWVVQHASEFGGSSRQVCVGGDSCGGNLAAAVCLLAKERGQPAIAVQMLLYPMTAHYLTKLPSTTGVPSLEAYATGYNYDATTNSMGWDLLGAASPPYGTPENPDFHAAILQAPDLSGLPPAVVVLGQCDIVRDEGKAYADRMVVAGNDVVCLEYPASTHGFMALAVKADQLLNLDVEIGNRAIRETMALVNERFGQAHK